MKTLEGLNLNGKKVLLRTDFDVPVSSEGMIQEVFRIKKQKPMIDHLVSQGAITVMVAHVSDEDVVSLNDLIPQLQEILGHEIKYFDALNDLEGLKTLQPGFLGLLHRLRDHDGEEKNDKEFAQKLAEGFDVYINNAFAVSHRNHASVSAITEFLPSYPGFVVEEETANLGKALSFPSEGKIFIMGGAKASTKIPVMKNFLNKCDKILVGGVIANDILKKNGVDVNGSLVDDNLDELFSGLDLRNEKIAMPSDYSIQDGKYLDIGPESFKNFRNIILEAKMVIWNGPMGLFEDTRFARATNEIAKAIVDSHAIRIMGGGDTIAAVDKLGILDKFDFVSTGGGAMLEFLAGNKLPGLEALGYYK